MASQRRPLRRLLLPALAVVSVFALAGCGVIANGPQNVSDPTGDNMRKIWNLFIPIFWASVVIFVIVQAISIYAVIRFRRRPDSPLPHAVHGNTRLEIAWTILPALILVVVAVPTLTTIADLHGDPGDEAVTIRVIGHQWWWEFQYPDEGIVTAGTMHVPVDRPVRLELQSADVIHSFWPPKLAGKQDVVPGHNNLLIFTPEEIGEFRGQCAEFCGTQHANMAFSVAVDSADDYAAWLEAQKQPAAEPQPGTLEAQGKDTFMTSACVGCHTINGTQAQGITGPNLTHVGSRGALAGHTLPNTPEDMARWIADPQAVKPGTLMPDVGLSDDQVNAVVAYLESLK